jgi:hypothetical protein
MRLFLFTLVGAVKAATPITTVAPELFNGWINLGAPRSAPGASLWNLWWKLVLPKPFDGYFCAGTQLASPSAKSGHWPCGAKNESVGVCCW